MRKVVADFLGLLLFDIPVFPLLKMRWIKKNSFEFFTIQLVLVTFKKTICKDPDPETKIDIALDIWCSANNYKKKNMINLSNFI